MFHVHVSRRQVSHKAKWPSWSLTNNDKGQTYFGVFGKRNPHFITELYKTDLHISGNFARINSRVKTEYL